MIKDRIVRQYRISELVPYINWLYFYHAWGLSGKPRCDKEKMQQEALDMLASWEDRFIAMPSSSSLMPTAMGMISCFWISSSVFRCSASSIHLLQAHRISVWLISSVRWLTGRKTRSGCSVLR